MVEGKKEEGEGRGNARVLRIFSGCPFLTREMWTRLQQDLLQSFAKRKRAATRLW